MSYFHPSRVAHRVAVLAIVLTGMGVSIYLGLFQLHVLSSVWDPVFGAESTRVLESSPLRELPIPDSLLGAVGYFSEAIALAIGGKNRFVSCPWSVLLYAIIALAMGAVSLGLLVYQTFVLKSWCTLCLFSALLSILLVLPALQETFPAIRVVRQRRNRGESWRTSLRLLIRKNRRPSDAKTAA